MTNETKTTAQLRAEERVRDAGPELLAALRGMLELNIAGCHDPDKTCLSCKRNRENIAAARAAIAKAEGRE